jgi:hypothetical protein
VSILDKLTTKQLLVFSEIVADSKLMQIEFVREKYLRGALNFDETVEFLRELGMVDIQGNEISLNSEYKTFLASKPFGQKEPMFKSFIGRLMVQRNTEVGDEVMRFARNFRFRHNQYEFKPDNIAQRLESSGIRNLLMDLEVLRLEPGTMTYVMDASYYAYLCENLGKPPLAPGELIEMERRNREIGLKAELRIVEYEKQRLAALPGLVERVEHVAKHDVSAGYDIRSCEGIGNEPESVRLIEVKAVSIWDYRFNWTTGEIETAKINRQRYYLYLLPVTSKGEFDLATLKIISDPYTNVLNSKEWTQRCEVLSLSMVRP